MPFAEVWTLPNEVWNALVEVAVDLGDGCPLME